MKPMAKMARKNATAMDSPVMNLLTRAGTEKG